MKNEWAIKEIKNIEEYSDYLVLENPDSKNEIDNYLKNDIFPSVAKYVKKNHTYPFEPEVKKDIHCITEAAPFLQRSMCISFWTPPIIFYQCKICCGNNFYFINNKSFVFLEPSTEPSFIFRILGDDKFIGMPPSLENSQMEHGKMLYLNFESGYGKGFRDKNTIVDEAVKAINAGIEIETTVCEGLPNIGVVEEFLAAAYKIYSAE